MRHNSGVRLPFGRALTVDDIVDYPDDGHRYELIDGTLVIGPSCATAHQRMLASLTVLLHPLVPPVLEMLHGPFNVRLADHTQLQPDLVVAPREQFTEWSLLGPPLLTVEVLSPNTRRHDLMVKHSVLEEFGCPSYWVIDPDEPRLIAWELRDGKYVEVANVAGDETWAATLPFPVAITPAALLD